MDDLREYQRRLERHFKILSEERKSKGLPVFALEHNFSMDEIDALKASLKKNIAAAFGQSYWLLWVVYATEIGYEYDGAEYWDTYKKKTPLWSQYGDSSRLKKWFYKFHDLYAGFKPRGPWAEQFSIISWPISNAIVPRYLQGCFAKSLYDLRYELIEIINPSFENVGQYMSANVGDSTRRFKDFLEQSDLVGKISLALMTNRDVAKQHQILPDVLDRVVRDIGHQKDAKVWLKEAQSVFSKRVIGAKSSTYSQKTADYDRPKESGNKKASIKGKLQPDIQLKQYSCSEWSVELNLGRLSVVAREYDVLRDVLAASRCKLAGAETTWMPARWLIRGHPYKELIRWPHPGEQLIVLESGTEEVNQILKYDCAMSGGDIWVFKKISGGFAVEVRSRVANPGDDYIILSRTRLGLDLVYANECGIRCKEIQATELKIPLSLTDVEIRELGLVGLNVTRRLKIHPAGILPINWSDDGYGEWQVSDEPCFSIQADSPIGSVEVSLNQESFRLLPFQEGCLVSFIKLPALSIGEHLLQVKITNPPGSSERGPELYEVKIQIGSSKSGRSGVSDQYGIAIYPDPIDGSLDDLWLGQFGFYVSGPLGFSISVSVTFYKVDGGIIHTESLGRFSLPMLPTEWMDQFRRLTRKEQIEWIYLESASARVDFDAGYLGKYSFSLERKINPIRWKFDRKNGDIFARLIDEADHSAPISTAMYQFKAPLIKNEIDFNVACNGFQILSTGGLLMAECEAYKDHAIVSSPHVQKGLHGLVEPPNVVMCERSDTEFGRILDSIYQWEGGAEIGPLAGIRRAAACRGLMDVVVSYFYGRLWWEAEAKLRNSAGKESDFDGLIQIIGNNFNSKSYAVSLCRHDDIIEAKDVHEVVSWFVDVSEKFSISVHRDLSEFAVVLAGSPSKVKLLYGNDFTEMLVSLRRNLTLAKGARLIVMRRNLINKNDKGMFSHDYRRIEGA